MSLSFSERWVNLVARGWMRLFALPQRRRVHTRKATSEAKTVATTEIEWGVDMGKMSTSWSIGGGPERKIKLKGRCRSCWRGLIGRTDDSFAWTGIKCRVCGKVLEGTDAEEEERRMSKECMLNVVNMDLGRYPQYGDGPFAEKLLPDIDRLTEEELAERIATKVTEAGKGRVRDRLTRNDFPEGSLGLLLLQAKILMVGVERFSNPQEMSVVAFPEIDVKDDGSLVAYVSMEGLKEDPQYREYGLLGQYGFDVD